MKYLFDDPSQYAYPFLKLPEMYKQNAKREQPPDIVNIALSLWLLVLFSLVNGYDDLFFDLIFCLPKGLIAASIT